MPPRKRSAPEATEPSESEIVSLPKKPRRSVTRAAAAEASTAEDDEVKVASDEAATTRRKAAGSRRGAAVAARDDAGEASTASKSTAVAKKAEGKKEEAKKEKGQTEQLTSGPGKAGKTANTAKAGRAGRRKTKEESPETSEAAPTKQGKGKVAPKAELKISEATAQPPAESNATSSDEEPRPWFWLMKAEPESRIEKGVDVKFSIDDLASRAEPEKWDGVRNYVARNNMRAMRKGEQAFFYHSNCKIPGIAGLMEIVGEAEDDESAFDEKHPYFDPKSKRDNPKWSVVRVQFVRKFDRLISLPELRRYQTAELKEMPLLKQGRLSVSRVGKKEWDFIIDLEKKSEAEAEAAAT